MFGWDLEWSPENWGAPDQASTLTSAEDLARMTLEAASVDACVAHSEKANVAFCDSTIFYSKMAAVARVQLSTSPSCAPSYS